MNRDRLALAGWAAAVLAVPVFVDVTAIRRGWETMSRLYARGVLHPIAGPVVIGGSAALAWHLAQTVADEWGNRAEARRVVDDYYGSMAGGFPFR